MSVSPPSIDDPAHHLVGRDLDGEWTVVEKIHRPPSATGSNFSVGYYVQATDGRRAFLKALDFSRVMRQKNTPDLLKFMNDGYIFERDMLSECDRRRMSRIVRVLKADTLVDPQFSLAVPYLILEPADGDIRSALDAMSTFDTAWALSACHDAAVGVRQLHGARVAHQDLKPSNFLTFGEWLGKLGDLGRCSKQGREAPHDRFEVRGDPIYAPPELLYGQLDPDWMVRCQACDVYLLGSLILFIFTRTQTTAEIMLRLPTTLKPPTCGGTFVEGYSKALPYLINAFDEVADSFERQLVGQRAGELVDHFRALCHPDPGQRAGSAQRRRDKNPYDVQRLISRLDVLRHDARGGYLSKSVK